MNNDVSAPSVLAPAEGTTLPPPRAFRDTNTLTVPRSRSRRPAHDLVARLLVECVAAEPGALRLSVVPADSAPITLTL